MTKRTEEEAETETAEQSKRKKNKIRREGERAQTPQNEPISCASSASTTEALFHFVRTSAAPSPPPPKLVKGFSRILHPLAGGCSFCCCHLAPLGHPSTVSSFVQSANVLFICGQGWRQSYTSICVADSHPHSLPHTHPFNTILYTGVRVHSKSFRFSVLIYVSWVCVSVLGLSILLGAVGTPSWPLIEWSAQIRKIDFPIDTYFAPFLGFAAPVTSAC